MRLHPIYSLPLYLRCRSELDLSGQRRLIISFIDKGVGWRLVRLSSCIVNCQPFLSHLLRWKLVLLWLGICYCIYDMGTNPKDLMLGGDAYRLIAGTDLFSPCAPVLVTSINQGCVNTLLEPSHKSAGSIDGNSTVHRVEPPLELPGILAIVLSRVWQLTKVERFGLANYMNSISLSRHSRSARTFQGTPTEWIQASGIV